MIYAMQPVGGGPLKIGHSCNVERRRRELETEYGRRMVVLGTREGGYAEEQQVFERFKDHRIGLEQFKAAKEILEFFGVNDEHACDCDEMLEQNPNVTRQVLTLRGSEEYREWLADLAKACKSQLSELVADALAEKAELAGFRPPPRRR